MGVFAFSTTISVYQRNAQLIAHSAHLDEGEDSREILLILRPGALVVKERRSETASLIGPFLGIQVRYYLVNLSPGGFPRMHRRNLTISERDKHQRVSRHEHR